MSEPERTLGVYQGMRTIIALGLLLSAVAAGAQVSNDAFGALFDDMTLEEAIDESIAQSKLLVLYVDHRAIPYAKEKRSRECLAAAKEDRLLRFWLRQHAIVLHLGPEHRDLAEKILAAARERCERANVSLQSIYEDEEDERIRRQKLAWYTPAFGIFLNGNLFSAVTACRLPPWMDSNGVVGGGMSERLGTAMTWAVFELDFQLDRIAAKEPVWHALHELRNPPLEAEARTFFSEIEDANANRFGDELHEYARDVLGAIKLARTQAELGDRFGSAATYTWLWEKGANEDPDYGPAIRTLITADVKALVERWENYADRFSDMKIAATKRLGLETLDEFGELMRLAAVTGDPMTMLKELDYRLNSDYFGSLLPRDERRVLLMIAETECEVMERLVLPEYERDTLNRLLINYETEQSELAKPELRRLALDQAVLLHARMLEEGLESEAQRVGRQAMDRIGPDAGRALIAGALVVGEPRPWHMDYLPEDGKAARLAEHLQKALEDAAASESDQFPAVRLME